MWALLLSLLSKLPGLLAGPVSQILTGLNFASMLGGVGNFIGLVFSNIKAYWRYYLSALLIGAQLATCYGWDRDHNLLLKERAAHQLDINNFKAAQAAANDKEQAEKTILKKESKANADQADASYSTLYAQYRSVLLRYRTQTGTSATSQPDHNQLPSAQSGNGPSASTEVPAGVISITLDDANVCAINTARLQAVRDWALNPPKDGTQ